MQTFNFTQTQSSQILMLINDCKINSDELTIISNTLTCKDNIYSYIMNDAQLGIFTDLLLETNDLDLITTLVKQDRNNVIQPLNL